MISVSVAGLGFFSFFLVSRGFTTNILNDISRMLNRGVSTVFFYHGRVDRGGYGFDGCGLEGCDGTMQRD